MFALQKLTDRMKDKNSLVCVGLDSNIQKIPERFLNMDFPQFEFNKWIIDQTHEYACAYKPNIAFYEELGDQGVRELKMTMEYIQTEHSRVFTICDAKRADIGPTNEGYAVATFDWLGFDSITLHPYLGREALEPFLKREDKVSIILCRTSNPGAGEFQDLEVDGQPLWKKVATKISSEWNTNKNCMLVVGATYPHEMGEIRDVVGDMTLLVPGIGAQGGSVKEVMNAGMNSEKMGLMLNSSRDIIFSENPGEKAKALMEEINTYR